MDTVTDINDKELFPLGPNDIGYVRLTQFGEKTSDELDSALKKLTDQGMKALILDLRENPGGLLEQAGQVCEKFLPRGQLIVSTEGRGATTHSDIRAQGHGKRIDLPLVVLVNGDSASASEIVAGCLQDLQPITHAIVVGEQTFGKGSVQSILPLADGSALRLTTAHYYTPSHKVIHQHGITPDIVVAMSQADETDLRVKHYPGALEMLDSKDRVRVEACVTANWSGRRTSSRASCFTLSVPIPLPPASPPPPCRLAEPISNPNLNRIHHPCPSVSVRVCPCPSVVKNLKSS